MLNTHGGGQHFVPEEDDREGGAEPGLIRVWRSLENPDKKLLVLTNEDGLGIPANATTETLDRVTARLVERAGVTGALLGAFQSDELDQSDVSEAKQYDPLIPGGTRTGSQPSDSVLENLAQAMLTFDDNESDVPAAYTYFGQFLAHDMSYLQSKTVNGTVVWENANALHALEFRSLFGTVDNGHPSSPWSELGGSALGLASEAGAGQRQGYDLPRSTSGGLPCCSDPRADSNVALAQMHVLLVLFHQRMAKALHLSIDDAQRETKHHLQAIALTDYLPRIIPEGIYSDVMQNGRKIVAPSGAADFNVSLEFATAVFRFGHSMIRRRYDHWIIKWPEGSTNPDQTLRLWSLLDYTHHCKAQSGRLPNLWTQGWWHQVGAMNPKFQQHSIFARPIAASISAELGAVTRRNFPDVPNSDAADAFNLGLATLRRNGEFEIPTGQEMVEHFKVPIQVNMSHFFDEHALFDEFKSEKSLCENTPLWFYTLAEAESCGHGKLGPLGARVVMETFHAALESDTESILKVSPEGVSTVQFSRSVRIDDGPAAKFALRDVVAVAYGHL